MMKRPIEPYEQKCVVCGEIVEGEYVTVNDGLGIAHPRCWGDLTAYEGGVKKGYRGEYK